MTFRYFKYKIPDFFHCTIWLMTTACWRCVTFNQSDKGISKYVFYLWFTTCSLKRFVKLLVIKGKSGLAH